MKLLDKINQTIHSAEWRTHIQHMWLPTIFAFGLGVTICIMRHCDNNTYVDNSSIAEFDNIFAAIYFFGIGYVLSTLLQFTEVAVTWRLNKKQLLLNLGIQLLCFVPLVIDSIWIANNPLGWSIQSMIGHGIAYASLAIGFVVYPTIHQPNDNRLQRFSVETLINYFLFFIAFEIIFIALCLLYGGIETLFNIDITFGKVFKDILTVLGTTIGGVVGFLLITNPRQEGLFSKFAHKLCNIAGKYIFFPLVTIYMLVLYAYLLKIIFAWELPNGTVTWMTTVMMILLLATIFLLYPTLYSENGNKKLWCFVKRILPILTLPLLILMSIGIARRVSDYGWTIARIYALLCNIWFYIACGMLIVASYKEKKILSQLMLSFCTIALLTSVIPNMNVAQCTKRVLTRQVETLINNAPVAFPEHTLTQPDLKTWLNQQDEKTARAIHSKLSYLRQTYGRESVEKWCSDTYGPFILFDDLEWEGSIPTEEEKKEE